MQGVYFGPGGLLGFVREFLFWLRANRTVLFRENRPRNSNEGRLADTDVTGRMHTSSRMRRNFMMADNTNKGLCYRNVDKQTLVA